MKTLVLVAAMLILWCLPTQASTVAYWRFEEGPANGNVLKGGVPDGVFYPGVADSSGNGNALSAWTEGGGAGHAYRTDVPGDVISQGGAANNFSVQNTDGYPGMFTDSAAMRTMSPAAFTIEASYKPETGGYRTIVGRDSRGAAIINGDLAALYLQVQPGDAVAIQFADVRGNWHQAVSAAGAITGFPYPDSAAGHWYNIAAVSDGNLLSLYLDSVDDTSSGYQLVAQTDMTLSASLNTALTAGLGSGADWTAGNWTVGRGLYAGGHSDRAYGFIDEVRISDSALTPDQFLSPSFEPVPEPSTFLLIGAGLGGLALWRRRRYFSS